MTAPTWLGPIRQTAFVVDDIEAAANEWVTTHGVGPWFLYNVSVDETQFRGATVPMRARMGLAQSGGQQIELIQPDLDVPSVYTEFTNRGGTGVHHVCYWADIDRATSHFTAHGSDVVLEGVTGNGSRFVYLSGSAGVPFIEIVDPQGPMATFFAHIATSAENWDGSNPIR
jgi:hypothetical protein